jgi:molecular chaperone GrpE
LFVHHHHGCSGHRIAAFDPNLHEAVAQEQSKDHPEGTILKEHHKGYTMHGRLLRPAQVVVSAKADVPAGETAKS